LIALSPARLLVEEHSARKHSAFSQEIAKIAINAKIAIILKRSTQRGCPYDAIQEGY
jgi:hypothetical protein